VTRAKEECRMLNRMKFDLSGKRVWVAGHGGLVGSALLRRLQRENCDVLTVGRNSVDLRRQADTENWLGEARPNLIFLAAATVGGILANETYPADFLYDNTMIAFNILEAALRTNVEKIVFLGSSCIYPRMARQPIRETALLTGPLESTNEWYAIAKIAGLKLAQAYRRQYGRDFVSAMPTNLYGPRDNFDLDSSHVLPALIRKTHEAMRAGCKELTIWGTGAVRREFLYVDDCADALVFLSKYYSEEQHINLGSGDEISIIDLARLIAEVVGFEGRIVCDTSRPDGTPRKLMWAGRLAQLGWKPKVSLREGIEQTYRWFLDNRSDGGVPAELRADASVVFS
jgi:GDP-L-fucose synthase